MVKLSLASALAALPRLLPALVGPLAARSSRSQLARAGSAGSVVQGLAVGPRTQPNHRDFSMKNRDSSTKMDLSENSVSHIPMDYHHVPHENCAICGYPPFSDKPKWGQQLGGMIYDNMIGFN